MDEEKARERVEWDSEAQLEVYDTDENDAIEKFYKIRVEVKSGFCPYDGGHVYDDDPPKIEITKSPRNSWKITDFGHFENGDHLINKIWLIRYVRAENWDEEFYRNKYTKAAYDYLAIAKQKLAEGALPKEINEMFGTNSELVKEIENEI